MVFRCYKNMLSAAAAQAGYLDTTQSMEDDHRALETPFIWLLVLSSGGRVANLCGGLRVFSCMLPERTIKHLDGSGHGGSLP